MSQIDEVAPETSPADMITELEERVRVVDGAIRQFVVDRPVVALLGAVASGFVLGRLLNMIDR